MRLSGLWSSFSSLDRATVVAVLCVFVSAFFTWPLVSRLAPEMSVIASWTYTSGPEDARPDPWGRSFVVTEEVRGQARGRLVYSLGPNGVDEESRGDDVVLFDQLGTRAPSGRVHAGAILLSQSRGFLFVLAFSLAGTYFSARRGPRAKTRGGELVRSFLLSLPVGGLMAVMLFLATYSLIPGDALLALQRQVVPPVRVALVGSVFVVSFVGILVVRLVHAGEGLEHPEAPKQETLEEAAQRWLPEILESGNPKDGASVEPPEREEPA